MLRSFLVLLVCCEGFSVTLKFDPFEIHQECGPNELAKGCINPCPPEKTCQDREDYSCLAVVVPCQFQCHCKEGFIRKTDGGECIPEEECGPYCGPGQVYTDCKKSCLNETCAATKNPPHCVNEMSESEPCQPGCICKDGYSRIEEDLPCIPRCVCPEMENAPDCLDFKDEYK